MDAGRGRLHSSAPNRLVNVVSPVCPEDQPPHDIWAAAEYVLPRAFPVLFATILVVTLALAVISLDVVFDQISPFDGVAPKEVVSP